jgi:hypothetical protein
MGTKRNIKQGEERYTKEIIFLLVSISFNAVNIINIYNLDSVWDYNSSFLKYFLFENTLK